MQQQQLCWRYFVTFLKVLKVFFHSNSVKGQKKSPKLGTIFLSKFSCRPKKKSSPKVTTIFCPNLTEDQKKSLHRKLKRF